MLPKIAAAISQFIQPIKTRQTETKNGDGGGGNAYSPLAKKKQEDSETKSVEPGQPQTAQSAPSPSTFTRANLRVVSNGEPETPEKKDVAKDEVFSFLRIEKDSPVHRWFGTRDYQQGSKRQKKAARAKKGALVDKKI